MTVSEMERGMRRTYEATSDKIRKAFAPYVEFIEPLDGVRGAGIVMKWGVEPIGDASDNQADNTTNKPDSGLHSRAWDDEFEDAATSEAELSDDDRELLAYIKTAPHLSDRGRRILMKDAVERFSTKQQGASDGLAG